VCNQRHRSLQGRPHLSPQQLARDQQQRSSLKTRVQSTAQISEKRKVICLAYLREGWGV
jgi:hypothetical protein